MYESIVDYKMKFHVKLEALVASGNAKPSGEDIAINCMV